MTLAFSHQRSPYFDQVNNQVNIQSAGSIPNLVLRLGQQLYPKIPRLCMPVPKYHANVAHILPMLETRSIFSLPEVCQVSLWKQVKVSLTEYIPAKYLTYISQILLKQVNLVQKLCQCLVCWKYAKSHLETRSKCHELNTFQLNTSHT